MVSPPHTQSRLSSCVRLCLVLFPTYTNSSVFTPEHRVCYDLRVCLEVRVVVLSYREMETPRASLTRYSTVVSSVPQYRTGTGTGGTATPLAGRRAPWPLACLSVSPAVVCSECLLCLASRPVYMVSGAAEIERLGSPRVRLESCVTFAKLFW